MFCLCFLFNQTSTATVQRLVPLWRKKFGEEVDQDFMYIVAVDRVLHLDDFQEVGDSLTLDFSYISYSIFIA